MSVAIELSSPDKTGSETREILGPAGNRVREIERKKKKTQKQKTGEGLKKKAEDERKPTQKLIAEKPKAAAVNPVMAKNSNGSGDRSLDSSSSSSSASGNGLKCGVKSLSGSKGKVKKSVNKPAKIVPDGVAVMGLSPMASGPIKRCDWITPNSEPLYIQFHDEEWGVPVHDDTKLFELLTFSQALAELSWSAILLKRDTFRIMLENFDPSTVAKFDDKKLLSLTQNGNTVLSESKLRAVVDNAKQLLKIQQEFGSFSNYCWRFVNNKQIKSGFRYARQVPAKTPKSELMSKDLMRRGFRSVGPTVVYSFMQVAGLVNDHLITCFRYKECESFAKGESNSSLVKTVQEEAAENTSISDKS